MGLVHIHRGCHLLIIGYLLNLFRGGLLFGILAAIGSEYGSWMYLFTVDILQFAGMAFLTIGVMLKLKLSDHMILIISFLVQSIGIWGRNLEIHSEPLALIVGLLLPTHQQAAFPLLLWLVYPVLGIIFANILQTVSDKKSFYKNVLLIGFTGLLTLTLTFFWNGLDVRNMYALSDNLYYDQTVFSTLWTLSVIFVALSVCYFLLSKFEHTKIGTLIRFGSRNVNTIYIVQWVLITILVSFEPNLSIGYIIQVGMIILLLAFGIAFFHEKRKLNHELKS